MKYVIFDGIYFNAKISKKLVKNGIVLVLLLNIINIKLFDALQNELVLKMMKILDIINSKKLELMY